MDTADTTRNLETTLNDMWRTRPTRIPKDQGGNAMAAGVCEGIGARYQIDPVIVRLAFVALALAFGGGIFVYLLLWMNLPRFGMPTSPWRAINTPKVQLNDQEKKERETGWWLLFGLVVFFPSLMTGTGGQATASIITFVVAAGAFYLLHRAHPIPPAGLSASARPVDTPTSPKVDTSHLNAPAGYPHPGAGRTAPPSWDPLGAAPELWHLPDLPEESAQDTVPPKRRSASGWLIGLSVAALIALAAAATTAGGLYAGLRVDAGNNYFTVTDNLQDTYDTGIGETTLDLSGLAPLDDDRTTTINHGIGKVSIIPPRDTRVEFTCDEGIGTDNCPATVNEDAAGGALYLNVDLGIGDIDVRAA